MEVVLDTAGVRRLYERMAPLYDAAMAPFRAFGAYRLADTAVAELRLEPGSTVVDLGTGTGRNLAPLARAVGPTGRVIGVDLSPGMLERARRRVAAEGLKCVELVEGDIATYQLPSGTSGVMASYAMEMSADYERAVTRLLGELEPGGRMAITGLREPAGWPEWLIRAGSALLRPFGVTTAHRGHHPWETLAMHARDYRYREMLFGTVYLATGTAPGS